MLVGSSACCLAGNGMGIPRGCEREGFWFERIVVRAVMERLGYVRSNAFSQATAGRRAARGKGVERRDGVRLILQRYEQFRARPQWTTGPGGAKDRSRGWSVAGAKTRAAEPVESSVFLSSRPGGAEESPGPTLRQTLPYERLPPPLRGGNVMNDDGPTGSVRLRRTPPVATALCPGGARPNMALGY